MFVLCLKCHFFTHLQDLVTHLKVLQDLKSFGCAIDLCDRQGSKFYFISLLFEVKVLVGVRDKLLSLPHGSGHMAIDIQ